MKMSEEKKQSEKKKKKDRPRNFLEFYQMILMRPLIVLAVIVLFFVQFMTSLTNEVYRDTDTLYNSAESQEQFLEHYSKEIKLYNTMQENYSSAALKIAAMGEADGEITKERLDTLNQVEGDQNVYYYMTQDGTIISGTGRETVFFNDEEKNKLLQSGKLRTDSALFFARKCGSGTLIAKDSATQTNFTEYQPNLNTNYISFDKETGMVVGKSVDASLEDDFARITSKEDLCLDGSLDYDDLDRHFIIFSVQDITSFDTFDMYLAIRSEYTVQSRTIEDYQFISLRALLMRVFRANLMTIVLIAIFVYISLRLSRNYREKWKTAKIAGKEKRISRRYYGDTMMVSNLVLAQTSVAFIVILTMIFLQSLTDFADYYNKGREHLASLESAYASNYEDSVKMQELFERGLKINTEACVRYLSNNTEGNGDVNEFLQETANAIGAEEISVFDYTGAIEYSTSNYVGYTLSLIEDDPENRLWQLIDGSRKTDIFELDEENGIYCCAMRRVDAVGLVLIKMSDSQLQRLQKEVSFENLMVSADFGSSDKFYVLGTDETTLNYIPAGSQIVAEIDNILPVPSDGEKYVSVCEIGERQYFVNGCGFYDNAVFCADDLSSIISGILPNLFGMALVCAFITLLTLLGTCIYTDETAKIIRENANDGSMEVYTKREVAEFLLKEMIFGLRVVLAATFAALLLNCITCPEPILSFLYFVDWQEGANIFAFSATLFATILVLILWQLIRWFFGILETNLPSRSATICQMVCSLLSASMFLWLVLYGLDRFGIKASTILAGVGVTSIVLGIGAKDFIDDILEGIAIIIEGHIRVGDVVELETRNTSLGKYANPVWVFRGTVAHIGIRSTRIRGEDREICVNNSSLKNVQNFSRMPSLAEVYFTVGFETDMDRLESILKESEGRLREASDGLICGEIVFAGVIGYNDHGMQCLLKATVNEHDLERVTAGLHTEIAKILRENEISLFGGI